MWTSDGSNSMQVDREERRKRLREQVSNKSRDDRLTAYAARLRLKKIKTTCMHIHTPLGIRAGSATRGWLRRNTKPSRAYSNVQTNISSAALASAVSWVDNAVDGYDGNKPAITVEASAAANRSGLPRCDGITSRAQSGLAYEVPSSSSWRVLQERLELRRFHGSAVPC